MTRPLLYDSLLAAETTETLFDAGPEAFPVVDPEPQAAAPPSLAEAVRAFAAGPKPAPGKRRVVLLDPVRAATSPEAIVGVAEILATSGIVLLLTDEARELGLSPTAAGRETLARVGLLVADLDARDFASAAASLARQQERAARNAAAPPVERRPSSKTLRKQARRAARALAVKARLP